MAEKRPFRIILQNGPSKGALGGSLSRYVPPGAQYDYDPPSVFARYKILSIVFGLLLAAILSCWLIAPHGARPRTGEPAASAAPHPAAPLPGIPPAADPVYVEPLQPPSRP